MKDDLEVQNIIFLTIGTQVFISKYVENTWTQLCTVHIILEHRLKKINYWTLISLLQEGITVGGWLQHDISSPFLYTQGRLRFEPSVVQWIIKNCRATLSKLFPWCKNVGNKGKIQIRSQTAEALTGATFERNSFQRISIFVS